MMMNNTVFINPVNKCVTSPAQVKVNGAQLQTRQKNVLNMQWNNQLNNLPKRMEQVRDESGKSVNSTRTVFEQLLNFRELSETVQLPPRASTRTCASLKFMNPLNVFGLSTVLSSAQHQ